jgi:hypothetical protein
VEEERTEGEESGNNKKGRQGREEREEKKKVDLRDQERVFFCKNVEFFECFQADQPNFTSQRPIFATERS